MVTLPLLKLLKIMQRAGGKTGFLINTMEGCADLMSRCQTESQTQISGLDDAS